MRLKGIPVLVLSALLLTMLCGCGEEPPGYPSLPTVDISDMELDQTDFPVQFPAGEFVWVCTAGNLYLYPLDSYDSDEQVCIEVREAYRHDGPLTEAELNGAVEALRTLSPFVSFLTAEMRELNGEPVFYIEQSAYQVKRALRRIDEDAAAAFESQECKLIVYMERNGTVYTYSGTYFTPEQKNTVLETISVLAQTTNR